MMKTRGAVFYMFLVWDDFLIEISYSLRLVLRLQVITEQQEQAEYDLSRRMLWLGFGYHQELQR